MVKENPFITFIMWVVGVLIALAGGGLFASGTTLNFPVLSWIPEIVHTIVGWGIIGLTLIGVVLAILKYFKLFK